MYARSKKDLVSVLQKKMNLYNFNYQKFDGMTKKKINLNFFLLHIEYI